MGLTRRCFALSGLENWVVQFNPGLQSRPAGLLCSAPSAHQISIVYETTTTLDCTKSPLRRLEEMLRINFFRNIIVGYCIHLNLRIESKRN
jgi:hypothetical protein